MDKPFQPKPYAGLIIYRVQKNIEYLLLNDSFSSKKHWFCPKGQVIGNEDNIKCALRETFELTGLRPTDLRIEEGFAIELRYLSGTKPKKVKYYLAQLLNNHVRLLPNAEGIHLQFHNQSVGVEKVIFKSMQDVLRHANTFIETKLQERKKFAATSGSNAHHPSSVSLSPNSSMTANRYHQDHRPKNRSSPVHQIAIEENSGKIGSLTSQPQQQTSPLYKTRLCERFETEGSCPYGSKCNFAHGINELRGKIESRASPSITQPSQKEESVDSSEHQLFKTKLCEKFMNDKFCQYGPKCHFAHGENELKERPKKQEEAIEQSTPRNQVRHQRDQGNIRPHTNSSADQRNDWRASPSNNHQNDSNRPSDASWRSGSTDSSWRSNTRETSWKPSPRETNWRSNSRESNWRSDTPNKVNSWRRPNQTEPPLHSPTEQNTRVSEYEEKDDPIINRPTREGFWRSTTAQPVSPSVSAQTLNSASPSLKSDSNTHLESSSPLKDFEELRRPTLVEYQARIKHQKKTSPASPAKDKRSVKNDQTDERSWMKIVKLSREEQDELENQMKHLEVDLPHPKSTATAHNAKSAQIETVIAELKRFFKEHPAEHTAVKGKLSEDVKEVTKVEMRNDLSKKQLLSILLISLLEEELESSTLVVLKSRDSLFRTFVKTKADQLLLLKSWDHFVTERKPAMINKMAAVLSHWYDCEMVEEDAFLEWYDTLEENSIIRKKSAKFIEWLNESDNEENE